MPFVIDTDLEHEIEQIAKASTVKTLGLTTEDIIERLKVKGYTPTRATVARVLRRIGIDNNGKGMKIWYWKKGK